MVKYDLEFYLNEAKEQITEIEETIEGFNSDSFIKDRIVRRSHTLSLIILGSAVSKIKMLCPEIIELNPDVDWEAIRNIWFCGVYPNTDFDEIWNFIQQDLPKIKHDFENLVLPPKPEGIFYVVKTIEFSEDKEDWQADLSEFENKVI